MKNFPVFAFLVCLGSACGGITDGPVDEHTGHINARLSVSGYTYTLTPRGGSGGSLASIGCAANYVVYGIYGGAGSYVDRLGLLCAYLNSDGSLGYQYRTGYVGGTGGTNYTITCPAGQAVVGLYGRSGSYVDQWGLYCSHVSTWRTSGTVESVTGSAGGSGGYPFYDVCPSAYVMTSINARAGSLVDQEQGVCSYVYP